VGKNNKSFYDIEIETADVLISSVTSGAKDCFPIEYHS
jgi:hypothetical protein